MQIFQQKTCTSIYDFSKKVEQIFVQLPQRLLKSDIFSYGRYFCAYKEDLVKFQETQSAFMNNPSS